MDRFVRGILWQWATFVVALATFGHGYAQQLPSPSAAPGASPGREQPSGQPATDLAATANLAEQIVVLRDGGILNGRVTRSSERVVLTRPSGELLIPSSNVMFVADSLEDAYEKWRERLNPPTATGHLALAEWCLRYDLLAHAERELADARSLDARHEKLSMLERRLALTKERHAKPVELHASESPTTDTPVAAEPAAEHVSADISDLPNGAVERFTRKVQPVLVNSCTTTGCHQAGGTESFQLDRAILRGLSNRRSTMSNLAATLALVDREQPRSSLLLTIPRRTHGGMKRPVFGPRQDAAFRHLEDWVALVTEKTAQPTAGQGAGRGIELASVKGDETQRWESPVMRVERVSIGAVEQAASQNEGATDEPADGAAAEDQVSFGNVSSSPVRIGVKLERWQPRDPFDPEIFNRQHSPLPSASAGFTPPPARRTSEVQAASPSTAEAER